MLGAATGVVLADRPPQPSPGVPTSLLVTRDRAVRLLLHRVSAAMRTHDLHLLRGVVDLRNGRFARGLRRRVRDARHVPLASYRVRLRPGWANSGSAATESFQPGCSAGRCWLRYRVAGFDPRPVQVPVHPLFVRRDDRWRLAALDSRRADGLPRPRELWDLEPVAVRRDGPVLAVAPAGRAGELPGVISEARTAIARVARVWPWRWARRVVVEVPPTPHRMARLAGWRDPTSGIAALTSSEVHTRGALRPAGDRIFLNPAVWPVLSAAGRQVVLTHEVTHVATRPVTGPRTPEWLSEGYADWVAYTTARIPEPLAAAPLAPRVAASGLPARPPPDRWFDGDGRRLAAYTEARLLCATIATRWGPRRLARFYRSVGTSPLPPGAAVRRATRRVLDTTPAALIRSWQSRVAVDVG